ncbi:uncharacterized protein LOC135083875 isoform X2 [Ostrinia nubilalis]|uniref:uncharacterized protein LOC135083875 isoform X2 n=1 Tax=Ostrinia nubilalis TaxID=29057 RepID=UPI00308264EB
MHGELLTVNTGSKEKCTQLNSVSNTRAEKKTHTVHQSHCSVTLDKNHQLLPEGFIDEQTTAEGGTNDRGYRWIGDSECESVMLVLQTEVTKFKMTPLVLLFALTIGHVTGVVELSCSDNATCIEQMLKDTARSLRQQKTVRLFDALTIEPLGMRSARANESPLTRFTKNHAFSFDWNEYTFRVTRPQGRSDVMDLEIYESRSAKGRRQRKKVLMAVIPLLFGMKSAAVVIFALAIVTALTLKAFVASKLALLVTVGMAAKKLYESYTSGVGLQNHPYLYSQYPIDFPSASSHAYSVSGVSPQFAAPEMYNPTAMANHPHAHELLQTADATAQQSQQAPTLQLVNSTRASERWDATFRGMNSDVPTTAVYEPEVADSAPQPKVILVPQPRLIAQRKMTYRKTFKHRPKKYTELKISLERLKHNKDLYDYLKTKKYKYNYPNTFYYPKVKFFVNPNTFMARPNNSRLRPYRRETFVPTNNATNNISNATLSASGEWKPIIVLAEHPILSINFTKKAQPKKAYNKTKPVFGPKNRMRSKRSIDDDSTVVTYRNSTVFENVNQNSFGVGRRSRGFLDFFENLLSSDFMDKVVKQAQDYAKYVIKDSLKSKEPPKYYSFAYEILMWTLELIDGYVSVEEQLHEHINSKEVDKIKPAKVKTTKKKKKTKS